MLRIWIRCKADVKRNTLTKWASGKIPWKKAKARQPAWQQIVWKKYGRSQSPQAYVTRPPRKKNKNKVNFLCMRPGENLNVFRVSVPFNYYTKAIGGGSECTRLATSMTKACCPNCDKATECSLLHSLQCPRCWVSNLVSVNLLNISQYRQFLLSWYVSQNSEKLIVPLRPPQAPKAEIKFEP